MGIYKKKSTGRPSRPMKREPVAPVSDDAAPDVDQPDTPDKPKKKKAKSGSSESRSRSVTPKKSHEKKEKDPKSPKVPREKSPKKEKSAKREKSPKKAKSPQKEKRAKSPKGRKGVKKIKRADAPEKESAGSVLTIIYPTSNTGIKYPPLYFRDGIHKVDFILVTTRYIIGNPDNLKIITNYVENLRTRNLLYEFEHGKILRNLFFIKINVLDNYIQQLACDYHINLSNSNPNYCHDKRVDHKFLQNSLNTRYLDDPLFNRSSSVAGDRPTEIPDAERSMIAFKVLAETYFGKGRNEFGHTALIKRGIFIDGYPLHDHSFKWTPEGPVSDRQLLRKYWAHLDQAFKVQPLNLIEKYFGTDNAFYFAWLGFYVKMLTVASLLGMLFFVAGGVYFAIAEYKLTREDICNSDIILCPLCKDFKVCKFTMLKHSCELSLASNFFDNDITVIFAIIMSLWSTLFLIYWRRYESRLSFRWNVHNLTIDTNLRYDYIEAATEQKILSNGEIYVYIPKPKKCLHIILTYSTCVFLLILIIAILFGYIIYCLGVRYSIYISKMDEFTHNGSIIVSITGSVFVYSFIAVFGKIYETVALLLTRFEYHRTELQHDNSYIYKMAALSFANNYAAITYLAFFKGKFYTYPGKDDNIHNLFGMGEDRCDPAGCLIDLTIQLASIMISGSIVALLNDFAVPHLKYKFNKLRYHRQKSISIPHWEEEFVLSRTSKYYLIYEWTSMLVQYGFVTFYVAALPIAPLIAWVNNILELRIDAIRMVTTSRRPIAHRTSGIGPYRGILKAMTIAGIATNAFVLAFTSDFVPRFMFAISNATHHYRKAKLSRYALADFPNYTPSDMTAGQSSCYYPGFRHPPGHPEQYTLTEDFWIDLAARFAFVLLFEHVLVTFTGILVYVIPKQSLSLEIESNKQEIAIRQAKNKILNEEREKSKKKRRFAFRKGDHKGGHEHAIHTTTV